MKKIILCIAVITACLQLNAQTNTKNIVVVQPNQPPAEKHRYIVVAHRGDHTIYPENTLEAYAAAIKDGADYVEIDLRTTRDGQLVSLHDAGTKRMTGFNGVIKELGLDDILKLKIAARNEHDTTTYHIPTFQEILKLCRNKINIYIDFKDADAAATLNVLKQFGMQKQVVVYINKPAQLTDWRRTESTMPLMLSMPDSVKSVAGMKQFIDAWHPDILDGNYNTYTAEMVQYASLLHIPIWPDAQSALEGPAVWEKAINLQLKGLQTDHPGALIKYLEGTGLR